MGDPAFSCRPEPYWKASGLFEFLECSGLTSPTLDVGKSGMSQSRIRPPCPSFALKLSPGRSCIVTSSSSLVVSSPGGSSDLHLKRKDRPRQEPSPNALSSVVFVGILDLTGLDLGSPPSWVKTKTCTNKGQPRANARWAPGTRTCKWQPGHEGSTRMCQSLAG